MSQLDQIFTDIAESIIEKDQGEGMKPTEMAERISNLPSGGIDEHKVVFINMSPLNFRVTVNLENGDEL